MTVTVRPGRPNGAASGFFSGMIREPLAGQRSTVPVSQQTPVAVGSPARSIEGLVFAATASPQVWGPPTAVNLPSLQTTVGGMAQALGRVAGAQAAALLDWEPDPAIDRLVSSWPGEFDWHRARAMGLQADTDFDTVIRDYIRENPLAIALTLA